VGVVLRGARSEYGSGVERESQDLDCGGTNGGAAAEDEDGLRLRAGGCAVREKGRGISKEA